MKTAQFYKNTLTADMLICLLSLRLKLTKNTLTTLNSVVKTKIPLKAIITLRGIYMVNIYLLYNKF